MRGKLLITGGSGFVAYHIICRALQEGLEVHVSTRPSSATVHLKELDINYSTLNFADPGSLQKELEQKQYDYIIHAAGSTRASSQEQYNLVNAVYTSNLAKAASVAEIPLKKFVFVSSLAAVGPSQAGMINENVPMQPVTGYGKSKLLAEQMLKELPGLPLIIFRPTAVYGPREKDILMVFKTISRGLEPYIGRKEQELSFVYVKDLAKLMVSSLDSEISGKAYNISDGNIYDKYALAAITKSIINKKTFRLHLPVGLIRMIAGVLEAAGSINRNTPALNREKIAELTASWACNIEPAKADLNFNPAYDLQAGLKETLEWYQENKWL
jgi:nucleoside-diphosphate-sugar epimerase